MSLVSDVIKSVAREGEITHEFKIKGLKFVLRTLSTEEQFIADGMIDTNRLKEKYGAKNLMTLNDTIQKHRTIAMVALATKTINGKSPVDTEKTMAEQFTQRQELRDELMELDSRMMDEIIKEYNRMTLKQTEFYSKLDENMEK
jgi:hypothetical protein